MSSAPLVTVVTPSYNQGHFIRATIESVLSQDYPNVEYIIIDGGSTDSTVSVVKDYASRLKFVSEKDRGQSHAINKGFRLGKGSILGWINSDDVYLTGAISAVVRAFSSDDNCGMVYGEGYMIDHHGTVQGRFPHSRPFDLWRLVYLSDYILQQSSYFSRRALDDVGYLDEDLHFGMDWDVFIRIGSRYPVTYIDEYLGCIRVYPETKSSTGGTVRAWELHRLLQKHTGMRLPPGSIIYGGETYWRLWQSWLEKLCPQSLGMLSRVLQFGLNYGAGRIIERTLHHSQGLYSDGWASDRLRFMLPRGKGSFAIAGSIPATETRLSNQHLLIRANGRSLGEYRVERGEFSVTVLVPPELEGEPLHLDIRSSQFYRPSSLQVRDSRRLAFIVDRIHWLESRGVAVSVGAR